jgi:hypothetical protein
MGNTCSRTERTDKVVFLDAISSTAESTTMVLRVTTLENNNVEVRVRSIGFVCEVKAAVTETLSSASAPAPLCSHTLDFDLYAQGHENAMEDERRLASYGLGDGSTIFALPSVPAKPREGDKAMASHGGSSFPGTITRDNCDGTYDVDFDHRAARLLFCGAYVCGAYGVDFNKHPAVPEGSIKVDEGELPVVLL